MSVGYRGPKAHIQPIEIIQHLVIIGNYMVSTVQIGVKPRSHRTTEL